MKKKAELRIIPKFLTPMTAWLVIPPNEAGKVKGKEQKTHLLFVIWTTLPDKAALKLRGIFWELF